MSFSLDQVVLRQLSRYGTPVFLFHKVPSEDDPLVPQELTQTKFEETLDFIEENFRVIPLRDMVEGIKIGKLPQHAACLTFDDGYAQWRSVVAPILHKRGLPATFFITTGQFSGTPMWHERVTHAIRYAEGESLFIPGFGLPELRLSSMAERVNTRNQVERFLKYFPLDVREDLLERLENHAGVRKKDVEVMPEEDIRHIHSLGFEVGAHTHLHPILTLSSEQESIAEIGDARDWLSGVVNASVNAFAYPNGKPGTDFHVSHVEMVRKAGYKYAVTTTWGRASAKTPVFEIPRFTPWGPSRKAMRYQLARNLVVTPRTIGGASAVMRKSKKVLYVENGAGFGGAVIALQTLLSSLSTSGQESYVISNLPVADFSAIQGVRAHRVIRDSIFNTRPVASRIQIVQPVFLRRFLLFWLGRFDDLCNRLPYFVCLLWQIAAIRPDVIHGNNEPSSNREIMLASKLFRIPYVQHLRGVIAQSQHTSWLLKRPDVFIPVSRWLAGQLLVAGVPNERIRQIYDAVEREPTPIDRATARERLNIEFDAAEGCVVVAMIGMLVEWKGQHHFVEAVKRIAATNPTAIFLIIGGVPEKTEANYAEQIEALVRNSGIASRLLMMGRRNDLPSLLAGIDVVVSASTEPEPLGLVMLEALLAGCKFVGPSFGAATEVITAGTNGFLFEPGNVESLAEQIQSAIQEKYVGHGGERRDSPKRGLEQFSPQSLSENILRVYENLIIQ